MLLFSGSIIEATFDDLYSKPALARSLVRHNWLGDNVVLILSCIIIVVFVFYIHILFIIIIITILHRPWCKCLSALGLLIIKLLTIPLHFALFCAKPIVPSFQLTPLAMMSSLTESIIGKRNSGRPRRRSMHSIYLLLDLPLFLPSLALLLLRSPSVA